MNTAKEKGFTFIEFTLNLFIIGMIVVVLVHKYRDLTRETIKSVKYSMIESVRSAWEAAITRPNEMGRLIFPTLDELAQDIEGATVVSGKGIGIPKQSTEFIVTAYTGPLCRPDQKGECTGDCYPATSRDEVRCVGVILSK